MRFPFLLNSLLQFFNKLPVLRSIGSAPQANEQIGTTLNSNNRIESIDLLRGLVMVIMALDHVRSYLHFDTFIFSPTDVQHTTRMMFATRLITHLCAPTFIFLAGTSAYFIAQRKTVKDTATFLLTRGSWLILLQVTLIQFGWNFDPAFHFISSNIISTIGFCMIALSFLIHLQFSAILAIGLVMVLGHNLLDNVSFESGSMLEIIWSFLHGRKIYALGNNYSVQFIYPMIPWIGVIALGFCFGRLYDQGYSVERRKKITLWMGIVSLVIFILLRAINSYGDPHPWSHQQELSKTILSFFNIEKYPPSLIFLCFTLGCSLVALSILEGRSLGRWKPITLFGKVSLFYYVIHVFVIHVLTLIAVVWAGYPWQTMIFIGSHNEISPLLKGKFGFSLGEIYLIWIAIVLLLYPLCVYWNSFKIRNKLKWWVSYV